MKIRVPRAVKAAFNQLADLELTTESEIARRALLEYLARQGYTAEILRGHKPGTLLRPLELAARVKGLLLSEPSSSALPAAKEQVVATVVTHYGSKRRARKKPAPP